MSTVDLIIAIWVAAGAYHFFYVREWWVTTKQSQSVRVSVWLSFTFACAVFGPVLHVVFLYLHNNSINSKGESNE